MAEFEVRELEEMDLDDPKDFFEALSNMRDVGELTPEQAKDILLKINSQDSHIFVAVTPEGKIIGSATILIEQKFIRKGAKAGHLEDVSVMKGYEGKGIGSSLCKRSIEFAKKMGCYKIIADCSEENTGFYEKLGFNKEGDFMRIYL